MASYPPTLDLNDGNQRAKFSQEFVRFFFSLGTSLISQCMFGAFLILSPLFFSNAGLLAPAYSIVPLLPPLTRLPPPIMKLPVHVFQIAITDNGPRPRLRIFSYPKAPQLAAARNKEEVSEKPIEFSSILPNTASGEGPNVDTSGPRRPVETGVLSQVPGNLPQAAKRVLEVQTGGFGDPEGANRNDQIRSKTLIARTGSFELSSGSGKGSRAGGNKGIHTGGFGGGSESSVSPMQKPAKQTADFHPVEILNKPNPTYSEEACRLRIEGEVLVDVQFGADGGIRVLRVIHNLGHGLDEAAVQAAEAIQFKPATVDGHPVDFAGTVHIYFQLAY